MSEKHKNRNFRWLLYPLALLYGFIVAIRNILFDWNIFHSRSYEVPIISVGNITVGGTGKTPHIEYLVELLQTNYDIAVLSRGYGRKTKGFLKAEANSSVAEIGDEPKQIKQKFANVKVVVDGNRRRGIKKLSEENERLSAVLLDDAFQHRWVKPDLSILLIDFSRPLNEDNMLPYGELRENPIEKRRAQIVIITKTPEQLKPIEKRIILKNLRLFPYQSLYFTFMKYMPLSLVFKSSPQAPPSENFNFKKAEHTILLITGIANPNSLYLHIKNNYSSDIIHLKYADHHFFNNTELKRIEKTFHEIQNKHKLIITTEKDAMRLLDFHDFSELIRLPLYYIPIKIEFCGNDREQFNKQIFDYLNINKRRSKNKVIKNY